MLRPPVVVVIGRQGAGKGVQCGRLARALGADHLATGDLLRLAIRAGDQFGREVAPYVESGDLVPDELMTQLVVNRVAQTAGAGWGVVLDGFPRTVHQYELFEAAGGRVDVGAHLDVPRDVALERLARRMVCTECGASGTSPTCVACGGRAERRADDQPDAITRRLELYEAETTPLLDTLRGAGLLVEVDGTGAPNLVAHLLEVAVTGQLDDSVPA